MCGSRRRSWRSSLTRACGLRAAACGPGGRGLDGQPLRWAAPVYPWCLVVARWGRGGVRKLPWFWPRQEASAWSRPEAAAVRSLHIGGLRTACRWETHCWGGKAYD
ncbi:hypothetical protein NDU88_007436 [Pleurodeles waltl]|uniref:Secreted protein n=1 Tax=Pleurodeles waltl TaxID=8319 RepID=A0AAV7NT36_PLEWA|nr:hypothetical protein NDU88_007436 [Pleurodeles waltl]